MNAQLGRNATTAEEIFNAIKAEVARVAIVAREFKDAPSREAKLKACTTLVEHMRRLNAYTDETDKLVDYMRRTNAYADETEAANLGVYTDKTRESIADLLHCLDGEINYL